MTDENKSYRVTDRRHFTPDGESVATESPDDPPAEASSASTVGAEARPVHPEPAPADFITFIVSLASQAGALLGGTEGRPPDLDGAKWMISILEMLRDKTEGRRTAEETEALDTILYELRMAFVARSRAGGA